MMKMHVCFIVTFYFNQNKTYSNCMGAYDIARWMLQRKPPQDSTSSTKLFFGYLLINPAPSPCGGASAAQHSRLIINATFKCQLRQFAFLSLEFKYCLVDGICTKKTKHSNLFGLSQTRSTAGDRCSSACSRRFHSAYRNHINRPSGQGRSVYHLTGTVPSTNSRRQPPVHRRGYQPTSRSFVTVKIVACYPP